MCGVGGVSLEWIETNQNNKKNWENMHSSETTNERIRNWLKWTECQIVSKSVSVTLWLPRLLRLQSSAVHYLCVTIGSAVRRVCAIVWGGVHFPLSKRGMARCLDSCKFILFRASGLYVCVCHVLVKVKCFPPSWYDWCCKEVFSSSDSVIGIHSELSWGILHLRKCHVIWRST